MLPEDLIRNNVFCVLYSLSVLIVGSHKKPIHFEQLQQN